MQHEANDTSAPRSAADRLLEDSWEARARRASRRELRVELAAAAAYLAIAVPLLLLSGAAGDLAPATAAVLVGLYVLVALIEFPVGGGHVVPTQLALVPMLMLLPPGAVPLLVSVGLVGSTTIDWALRGAPARRILSAVPDGFHALGPAFVLVAAGSPVLSFADVPLMAGAFAASCVADLLSSLVRMRLAGMVPSLVLQARVMLTVWTVDACLAPLGFLAGATDKGVGASLFVAPLAILLWLLARDRHQRIEQAHTRLKLLERERMRLQSAVRRLGDAFAAKLELDGLLEILVHGSMEALNASAGRLEVAGLAARHRIEAGSADGDAHLLEVAVEIPAEIRPVAGTLTFAREGRPFADDEVVLVRELVSKAELAAAEILATHAMRRHAVTDALTGLGNRRRLDADLAAALERAAAERPVLLLLFDLDGFKAYNDTFGHPAGDALLVRLGAKLSAAVGEGAAYRLGGDEFCALLDVDRGNVEAVVRRASAALTETGRQFQIRASFGAILLPHEADSPDHALQLADERMYATKRTRSAGPRDQARDVLMRTMQAKQPDLDEHSDEVAQLAVRVARELGLSGEALDEVARAAELHDVGKVGIPDAILMKPAALDPDEWAFMHQHTILGERILNAAPALRPVARLVRASHERWDGTGYPDGLAGEEIPLGARIVAVCDAYEAMTADRPYRRGRCHEEACRELLANAGRQFDPGVVNAFVLAVDADEINRGQHDGQPADVAVAHIRELLAAPRSA